MLRHQNVWSALQSILDATSEMVDLLREIRDQEELSSGVNDVLDRCIHTFNTTLEAGNDYTSSKPKIIQAWSAAEEDSVGER